MRGFKSGLRPWIYLSLLTALLMIIPFLLAGNQFDHWFSYDANIEWMQSTRSIAWLAGVGLLIIDIVLPVPGTIVMSSLGFVYGWTLGAFFSIAGTFFSGIVAYAFCRTFGSRAVRYFLSADAFERGEEFFRYRGPLVIVLTRWLPVLSETGACIAGLARMPVRIFVLCLLCASIPLGIIYAGIGALGVSYPALAILLSVIAPLVMWSLASAWLSRDRRVSSI